MKNMNEVIGHGANVKKVEEIKVSAGDEVLVYADFSCKNCGCSYFWVEVTGDEEERDKKSIWTCAECASEFYIYPVYKEDIVPVDVMDDGEVVFMMKQLVGK